MSNNNQMEEITMPRCYKANSFGFLYTSFMRYLGLSREETENRLYILCTANIDTCKTHYPERHYYDINPAAFHKTLKRRKRPYRTEVQLYKSMVALRSNIACRALTDEQRETVEWLDVKISDLNSRFRERHGMDIDDLGTCYTECRFHIAPTSLEPLDPLVTDMLDKLEYAISSS